MGEKGKKGKKEKKGGKKRGKGEGKRDGGIISSDGGGLHRGMGGIWGRFCCPPRVIPAEGVSEPQEEERGRAAGMFYPVLARGSCRSLESEPSLAAGSPGLGDVPGAAVA